MTFYIYPVIVTLGSPSLLLHPLGFSCLLQAIKLQIRCPPLSFCPPPPVFNGLIFRTVELFRRRGSFPVAPRLVLTSVFQQGPDTLRHFPLPQS